MQASSTELYEDKKGTVPMEQSLKSWIYPIVQNQNSREREPGCGVVSS